MSESDYQSFFYNAPLALCRTDTKTGKFQMANECAVKMFGCTSEEELIKNHKSTDFYPKEIRQKLIDKLRQNGTVQDEEIELHLSNEKIIWIRANFKLSNGGDCIECYLTDITEIVELRSKQLNTMRAVSVKLDTQIASWAK
jgi:PAS domain S-box-containing protein